MENLNAKLFNLISQYSIYDNAPELKDIYFYDCYVDVVNKIFENIPLDKVIALRGGGLIRENYCGF